MNILEPKLQSSEKKKQENKHNEENPQEPRGLARGRSVLPDTESFRSRLGSWAQGQQTFAGLLSYWASVCSSAKRGQCSVSWMGMCVN